ncbi:hypothetical protein MAR_032980 [Mya arenaria]|uniref:Uncharacterized protein n=1 Tax=Mya arenaria TaxID=6604 RepID=A0ABY7G7N8_MYAAR|nr:hypothetical protein MAR_032980 [Mya arenaria]
MQKERNQIEQSTGTRQSKAPPADRIERKRYLRLKEEKDRNDKEHKVVKSRLEHDNRKLRLKVELKEKETLRLQKEKNRNVQEHKDVINQIELDKRKLRQNLELQEKEVLRLKEEKARNNQELKLVVSQMELEKRKFKLKKKEKIYERLQKEKYPNEQLFAKLVHLLLG